MMQVQWDASGMEARLTGLSDAVGDLRPIWGQVHDIAIRFFRAIFAAQGSYPDGRVWHALNPRYAAWKRQHYGEQPILHLTGHLSESLTDATAADHVYRFGPSFMETGTRDIKARTHQWGFLPRHIPARPMIKKPSRAEGERIVDAILAYLFGAARRVS